MKQGKQDLQAVLFDLDGVVFDTEPQYSVFWGRMCRTYHPETPGLEHMIKGQTLTQIFDQYWSGALEKERDNVVRQLNEYESKMDYCYVNGFTDFIEDLKRHHIKTAVVTSSNRIKMEAVYRARPEFTSLFDAILTSEDFAESKPSPDCYLRAAIGFHLQPEQCAVFEDSLNGLRSGQAAGMMVVGLTTTNPLQKIKCLSDYQINDYQQFNYNRLKELWQAI